MRRLLASLAVAIATPLAAADLPIFDAHLHYSHDAWDVVPVKDAVALLRKAGLTRALVSSSSDEGTQKLLAAAPDLVVPELRPYRQRGELSTWMRDESVIAYLEERLAKHRYAGIGEFHLNGADADLPVPRRVVELAGSESQIALVPYDEAYGPGYEDMRRRVPNTAKLHRATGFTPRFNLDEALRRIIDAERQALAAAAGGGSGAPER